MLAYVLKTIFGRVPLMTFIFRILSSFFSAFTVSLIIHTLLYLFDNTSESAFQFSDAMLNAYLMLPFFLLIGLPISIFIDWYLTRKERSLYRYHFLAYTLAGIVLSSILPIIFDSGRAVEWLATFSILIGCSLIYFHYLLLLKKWLKFYKSIPLKY